MKKRREGAQVKTDVFEHCELSPFFIHLM